MHRWRERTRNIILHVRVERARVIIMLLIKIVSTVLSRRRQLAHSVLFINRRRFRVCYAISLTATVHIWIPYGLSRRVFTDCFWKKSSWKKMSKPKVYVVGVGMTKVCSECWSFDLITRTKFINYTNYLRLRKCILSV